MKKYELFRNGEIQEVTIEEMVEFWESFVEGQSQVILNKSKRIRELMEKIEDLEKEIRINKRISNGIY